MRNTLLIFFLLCASQLIFSQSITSDWFFKNGQISKKFAVTNADELIIPEGGVDMIWDYSNATAASLSDTLFEYFVAVQSMVNFDEFPNADLGRIAGPLQFYFDIQEDAILVDGLYANEFVSLNYIGGFPIGYAYGLFEPIMREYDIITYNNATMDTLSVVNGVQTTLELIGSGTVVTPDGSFSNCILQRRSRIFEEVLVFQSFAFYKDQYANQVATLNRSLNNNTGQYDLTFTYQTGLEELLSNSETRETIDWNIYYANDILNVISDREYKSVDLQLFDMSGRLLQKQNQSIAQGENEIDLDQAKLEGNYVLFVLDKESGIFSSFKIWISN